MSSMRLRVLVVVGCLLAASMAVARADRHEETPLRMSFALFPMRIAEWQGVQLPPFADDVLAILGLDDYVSRNYVRPDRSQVNLYIGYWQSQRQGDTMHSPQNCLPGAGWEPVAESVLTFADPRDPNAPPLAVKRFVFQKGLDKQVVLYWYQSRGRVIASEYTSKFYLVLDAARYNRTDAALVRVVTPVTGRSDEAEARAEGVALQFVKDLMPQLSNFLPN